jgi:hypothetical protein
MEGLALINECGSAPAPQICVLCLASDFAWELNNALPLGSGAEWEPCLTTRQIGHASNQHMHLTCCSPSKASHIRRQAAHQGCGCHMQSATWQLVDGQWRHSHLAAAPRREWQAHIHAQRSCPARRAALELPGALQLSSLPIVYVIPVQAGPQQPRSPLQALSCTLHGRLLDCYACGRGPVGKECYLSFFISLLTTLLVFCPSQTRFHIEVEFARPGVGYVWHAPAERDHW